MATFVSAHPSTPHTDFPANTPPDRDAGPPPPGANFRSMSKSSRKSQQRFSGEFRAANGLEAGRAIPTGPQGQASAPPRGPALGGPAGFEGSRSPPNAKSTCCGEKRHSLIPTDTSHVPCKFFKVGQCQAGQACPFSHATDSSAFEQPCKYFSRVSRKPDGERQLIAAGKLQVRSQVCPSTRSSQWTGRQPSECVAQPLKHWESRGACTISPRVRIGQLPCSATEYGPAVWTPDSPAARDGPRISNFAGSSAL
jgi:hypothetical protein